jgi:hypothetical protein
MLLGMDATEKETLAYVLYLFLLKRTINTLQGIT